MKYVLDVSVLLAAIWKRQPHHERAITSLASKRILLCSLAELAARHGAKLATFATAIPHPAVEVVE